MSVFTALDLTGYRQREDEPVWVSEHGVILSVHYFGLVPDLPAPLEQVDVLRARLAGFVAGAGAGLIETDVTTVDGLPAVRQLVKVRIPGAQHGQAFLASCTIPRAGCSAVLKVQAAEGQPTGLREAMVMAELGPDRFHQPHPYAPRLREGLPFHAADDVRYDDRFPGHPLTLVRSELARIAATARLDPRFHELPPFPGP